MMARLGPPYLLGQTRGGVSQCTTTDFSDFKLPSKPLESVLLCNSPNAGRALIFGAQPRCRALHRVRISGREVCNFIWSRHVSRNTGIIHPKMPGKQHRSLHTFIQAILPQNCHHKHHMTHVIAKIQLIQFADPDRSQGTRHHHSSSANTPDRPPLPLPRTARHRSGRSPSRGSRTVLHRVKTHALLKLMQIS